MRGSYPPGSPRWGFENAEMAWITASDVDDSRQALRLEDGSATIRLEASTSEADLSIDGKAIDDLLFEDGPRT